jgi:hypothetical protein
MPETKDNDFSAFDNAVKQEDDFSAFDNAVKKKESSVESPTGSADISQSSSPSQSQEEIPTVQITDGEIDASPLNRPSTMPFGVKMDDEGKIMADTRTVNPATRENAIKAVGKLNIQKRAELLKNAAAKTFQENPELFSDTKNRDIYIKRAAQNYHGDDYFKVLAALMEADPRSTPEGMNKAMQDAWGEKLDPTGGFATGAIEGAVEGIPHGLEQISNATKSFSDIRTPANLATALTGQAAGVVQTFMGAANLFVPELAAFTIGSKGAEEKYPGASNILAPVNALITKHYQDKGEDVPELASNMGVLADLVLPILLGVGGKKIAKKFEGKPITPELVEEAIKETPKEEIDAAIEKFSDDSGELFKQNDVAMEEANNLSSQAETLTADLEKAKGTPAEPIIAKKIEELNAKVDEIHATEAEKQSAEAHTLSTLDHLQQQKSQLESTKESLSPEGKAALEPEIKKVDDMIKEISPKEEAKEVVPDNEVKEDVIKDDDGSPTTFYHATNRSGLTELEPSSAQQFGKGVYFGSSKDAVSDLGDNIFEVHLPNKLLEAGSREYSEIKMDVEEKTGISEESDRFPLEKVNDEIKRRGYKGVVMDNDLYGGKEAMIFDGKDIVYKKKPGEIEAPESDFPEHTNPKDVPDFTEEEISSAYESRDKEIKGGQLSYKEQFIHDNFPRMTKEDFMHYGDRNWIVKGEAKKGGTLRKMALQYFSKKALPLDVQAQQMSEAAGIELTPQDFVDYVMRRELEPEAFKKKTQTQILNDAAEIPIDAAKEIEAFAKLGQDYTTIESVEAARGFPLSDAEADLIIDYLKNKGNEKTAKAGATESVQAPNEPIAESKGVEAIKEPTETSGTGDFTKINDELISKTDAKENGTSAAESGSKEGIVKEGEGGLRIRNDESPKEAGKDKILEDDSVYGIKNEKTRAENKYLGLPDNTNLTESQKRDINTVQENAKKYSGDVEGLVESALAEKRPLNAEELSAILDYKIKIANKLRKANDEYLEAVKDGKEAKGKEAEVELLTSKFKKANDALVVSGYEQGLAFRIRQVMKKADYSLAESVRQFEVASKGKLIPEAVKQRFAEIEKQIEEGNKKYDDLLEKHNQLVAEIAVKNIRKSIERETGSRTEGAKKASGDRLRKLADKIESGKINKLGGFKSSTGFDAIWDGSLKIVAESIRAGAKVIDAIEAGLKYVRSTDWYKELTNKEDFDKKFGDHLTKELQTGEYEKPYLTEDNVLKVPHQLIRDLVEQGVKDADDLVSKIHAIIKDDLPDVTESQIKETITGYGKTVNPTKEAIEIEIRKLKREGRLELGLDDAKAGKGVKRSGLQRDKPSDYERDLQKKINEVLKEYPQDQAELAKKWATALDRHKSNLKNSIADIEKRISDIKSGKEEPKAEKKKGYSLDQEAKDLTIKRDEARAQLQELEGKPELSDEQKVKNAISAAKRSMEDYQHKLDQLRAGEKPTPKPKNTAPETPDLLEARRKRDEARAQYKLLLDESGSAEVSRIEMYNKRVAEKIADLEKQKASGNYETSEIKDPIEFTHDMLKEKAKLEALQFERDIAIEKEKQRNRSMSQRVSDFFLDVLSLPKSLMASADFSAPLRQGAILSARNPKAALSATVEMFKQAFSEKAQKQWLAELHASDVYHYMKAADLYLSEPTVRLAAKEEAFISNIAGKIPGWGRVVKGSERAYTGYLNKLRADVFSQFYDAAVRDGLHGKELSENLKSYAKFVNNATGRGHLGKLELASNLMNATMFSPRYVASRFNLLANPKMYYDMPPRVRMEALKSMGTYIGVGMATLAIAKAAGLSVEIDPRNTDFGKIKVDNTRYDIWAGFQQWVRLFAQLATNEVKKSDGTIKELGEGYKADDRLDLLGKFARSKASPALAITMDMLSGKDMGGSKVTPLSEATRSVAPLYLQDMYNIYKEEGASSALISAAPAIFGVGVQTYDNKKSHKMTKEELLDLAEKRKNGPEPKTPEEKHKLKEDKDQKEAEIKKQFEDAGIPYVPPTKAKKKSSISSFFKTGL